MSYIKGITVYRNDVVIDRSKSRSLAERDNMRQKKAKRGKITRLSYKSRARLAFYAMNTFVEFEHMTTLTYPKVYPKDGRLVSEHGRQFFQWLKRNGGGEYLWFLEFQKRGAPHFHILHEGEIDREKVSKSWYKIVDSGDEKHLRAGTRTEKIREHNGARYYALKYAMKPYQKIVPLHYQNVGRFWGNSKGVVPEPIGRLDAGERELREIVKEWSQADRLGDDVLKYKVMFNATQDIIESLLEHYIDTD